MASPSLSVMANPRAGVRRCQPGAESSLGSGADPAGEGGGAAGPDDVLEKQYWSQVQGGSWRGWQCGVGASRWGVGTPLRVGQGTVDPAVSRSRGLQLAFRRQSMGLLTPTMASAHTHTGLCSHPRQGSNGVPSPRVIKKCLTLEASSWVTTLCEPQRSKPRVWFSTKTWLVI